MVGEHERLGERNRGREGEDTGIYMPIKNKKYIKTNKQNKKVTSKLI